MYWKWISRRRMRCGRKPTAKALRELIFRMVEENSTWGAPRIHGELKMLGYEISERTVLRWMRKAPRNPATARRWAAFLSNHRETIAAMDFLTVPTITFGVLYCFFVIAHHRRRIIHFNVTRHPTSAWVIQQLREAFPYDLAPRYLIFDRGTNFNDHVVDTIKSFGIEPKRISFQSPWQNGIAERFVGTRRPLAAGILQPIAAFYFGLLLSVAGALYLALAANLLAALLAVLAPAAYLFVYTPLERFLGQRLR
jgi:transposase InsO family protein